jgi:hypothetical protein
MIVMPLGQKDAAYLGAELGAYTPEDVANLSPERHEALCRPTTMAADTFLFTTLPPPQVTRSFAEEVINHTRAEYSTKNTTKEADESSHAAGGESICFNGRKGASLHLACWVSHDLADYRSLLRTPVREFQAAGGKPRPQETCGCKKAQVHELGGREGILRRLIVQPDEP